LLVFDTSNSSAGATIAANMKANAEDEAGDPLTST
jgi:hypothetical protein